MGRPKVIIIILNWNGKNDTLECLESLKLTQYPNYEILLVDNGSTDQSVETIKKRYPGLDMIVNKANLGYAEGNNVGIRRALAKNADYMLLLNNDTVVSPGFLDELIKVVEKDPAIGFAGPKVYYYDYNGRKDVINFAGGKVNLWNGRAYHLGWKKADAGQFDTIREVDYVDGSCLMVKKEVIEKIGLLDPVYFAYWEEADWCVRGHRAGYKLMYVPGSKIWHKISASGTGTAYSYYFARNQFIFMKKNAGKGKYQVFLLFYFFIELWLMIGYILVYKRDLERALSFFKGIADGIKFIDKNAL
jgi:GT2 family glycosyltransferase